MNNIRTVLSVLSELNYILSKPQKRRAVGVFVVIIISSLFELLGVSAVLPFIQAILTPDELWGNKYIGFFADIFRIQNNTGLLIFVGIGIILVYIVKNVYMLFAYYVQYDFATRVQKEVSVKLLHSYMSRPYTYYLEVNSSEINRACVSDVTGVYNILSNLFTMIAEALNIALIGIFIIATDWMTALGVLGLMVIVLLAMLVAFKPVLKRTGRDNVKAQTMKSKAILQTVSGIKEIFVMQRKHLFVKEYEEASDLARKTERTYSFINNSPDRIIEGICVSGLIGIICVRLCLTGDMASFVPKLAVFAMAAFKVMPSVGKITNRMSSIIYFRPMQENCYKVMKAAEEYEQSQESYRRAALSQEPAADVDFESELAIRGVEWKYEKQESPVLVDVSFNIHKGESIALIGASGAGKTTLADIILGLFRPQSGQVLMDGRDIFAMPENWARIVGYVPQSVFLMDDTVRSNVAFGIPAAQIDDAEIWDALERAQLREFVENLPEGLDTIVGERGVKFSGGQRQRIAIARALFNKPEILVLDEATSALDNETETAVMESIDALQGQITMIIVAHRLTTIRNCDHIFEIADGVAVERSKEEVLG